MPIEFRCPHCQKMLRVPDESVGARAKCPQCGAIADVPGAEATNQGEPAPSRDIESAPGSSPFGDDVKNPYAAPMADQESTSAKAVLTGQLEATPADVGEIIKYAFEVWKANLGLLVGITCVVLGVNIGFSIVQAVVESAFQQQGNDAALLGSLIGLAIGMLGNLFAVFLGIGQSHIVLKLLRDQRADFNDLFGGGPLFLRVLGACIIAGIALLFGTLACLVPALILSVLFWPFYWLLVDEKATALDSFGMAFPIGQANVGTTIVIWLATFGIVIVGFLAFCFGVLLAFPLTSLIWGTAYLMMSGQINTGHR